MFIVLLVHSFFITYLPVAFFLYGLAHFSMGLVILLEVRRYSRIALVAFLPLLGLFGIIYGISEWLDAVPLLAKMPSSITFDLVRFGLLFISAIILILFGTEVIGKIGKKPWVRFSPLFFIAAWAILAGLFSSADAESFMLNARILIFYLLYLPGTVLSGIGFLIENKDLTTQSYRKYANNFLVVAIALFLLAFFEGLITGKSFYFPASVFNEQNFQSLFAFPVELARGVLAIVIAVFIIRGLRIVEAESQRRFAFLEEKRRLMDILQESLLKTKIPLIKGIDIASHYESATTEAAVGGDFYDFVDLKDGRYAVVVGDVSGKGIEVAADAFLTEQAVRCLLHEEREPKVVLEKVNKIVIEQTSAGSFVTLALIIIQPPEKTFVYANAGHQYPILCSPTACGFLTKSATVLGNFEDASYNQQKIAFESGGTLVLYTDGLVEAKKDKELYGDERLKNLVNGNLDLNAQQLVNLVTRDVTDFSEGVLRDDIVLVVLKFGTLLK